MMEYIDRLDQVFQGGVEMHTHEIHCSQTGAPVDDTIHGLIMTLQNFICVKKNNNYNMSLIESMRLLVHSIILLM